MTAAAGLLVAAAAALVVLAAVTARRPAHAAPGYDGYAERWRDLHGGFDPRTASVWVRGWIRLVHGVARPLAAAGVHPDVLTAASLWWALAVLVPASAGGSWPLLAALLVVASGLLDALDGSVAVLSDRTSAWGYVLDSAVDRLSDVALLVAVVVAGAPAPLAVAVGTGVFLLEYVRARAGNAGGDPVGTVTVGERPVRVILVTAALLGAGALPGHADVAATAPLWLLAAFTAVGLGQLVVAVRRSLVAAPGATPTRPEG